MFIKGVLVLDDCLVLALEVLLDGEERVDVLLEVL
jgi:hypothetical protein